MQATQQSETWKPIPGYEGLYDVSDLGRVRSWMPWKRDKTVPRIKAIHSGNWGYPCVTFTVDGRSFTQRVHRLLMAAFVGPCPEGYEVRHLDGDPTNSTLGNLAYGTKSENQRDRIVHGTHNNAGKTHCKWGHEYTPGNTYLTRDGRRNCNACRHDRDRKRIARRQQARLAVRQ